MLGSCERHAKSCGGDRRGRALEAMAMGGLMQAELRRRRGWCACEPGLL